jgi:chromosome segregation ATPase
MARSSNDSFASEPLIIARRNSSTTTDDDDGDSLFSRSSHPRHYKLSQSSLEGDESETDTIVTVPSDSDLKSFFVDSSHPCSVNVPRTISTLDDHVQKPKHDPSLETIAMPLRQKMMARIDDFFNQQQQHSTFPKTSSPQPDSDELQQLDRRQLVDRILGFQQKYSDLTKDVEVHKRDQQRVEHTISIQQTMHASFLDKIGSVIDEYKDECELQGSLYNISLATKASSPEADDDDQTDPSTHPILLQEHAVHTHQMAFLHHLRRQLDAFQFPTVSIGPTEEQDENGVEDIHLLRSRLITAENQIATQQESQNHQIHHLSLQLATQNELLQNYKRKNSQLEEENRTLTEQVVQAQNVSSTQGYKVQVLERTLEQSVQQAARIAANLQSERSQWSQKMEQEIESLESRKRQAMATAQKAIEERDQVIRELRLRGNSNIYLGQGTDTAELEGKCNGLKSENEVMEKLVQQLRAEMAGADDEISEMKQQHQRKDNQIKQLEESLVSTSNPGTIYPYDDGAQMDIRKVQTLIALKDEAELNSMKMAQERHKAVEAAKALKIELKRAETKLKQSKLNIAKLEGSVLQYVNGNDLVQSKIHYLQEELTKADQRVAKVEKERAEWELRTEVAKSATRKLRNEHQANVSELNAQQESNMEMIKQLRQTVTDLESALNKTQRQNQETQSVLSAVQRSLAEREGEISVIKVQLTRQVRDHEIVMASEQKVYQTALDRMQRQHEEEITRLRSILADQHESNTKRNKDIAYLQTARHVHMLEDKVKELEYTMQVTYHQAKDKIESLERRLRKEHTDANEAIERWESKERAWRMQLAGVEAEYWRRDSKIKEMEQEVVCLYSKNLELIKELAKWSP